MLEELAEMQEDREIILLHLREALTLVDRMEASFRNQTTPTQLARTEARRQAVLISLCSSG
ncbi:hypothetical protein [Pantoea dispersa]|uniref:hypothetical protein n=1 Tax=Pantoea dispersa TaxID=59814 RepID=UPI0021C7B629|nr:hypothetical protein [Pantoea dispersa]